MLQGGCVRRRRRRLLDGLLLGRGGKIEGWRGVEGMEIKEGHERRRRTSEQKKTRGAEGRRACEENQGGREGWREDGERTKEEKKEGGRVKWRR